MTEDLLPQVSKLGYFAEPHLDKDLQKVLEKKGGWAGKIPNGDGFVLIHVKPATRKWWRKILRAENPIPKPPRNPRPNFKPKRPVTLRYRIKDEKAEPDASQMGFVVKVTFKNCSDEPFSDSWGSQGEKYKPKFRLTTVNNSDLWLYRYPKGYKVMQEFEGLSEFNKDIVLGPGESTSRILMFDKYGGRKKETVFFSDIGWMAYYYPFELPEAMANAYGRKEEPKEEVVGFPLFTLDPPEDKRAKVLCTVHTKYFSEQYENLDFKMWTMLTTGSQIHVNGEDKKKLFFQIDKYLFIPYSENKDNINKVKLWLSAVEPGVEYNIREEERWDPQGGMNRVRPVHMGPHLVFENPDPATGGREPDKVAPMVFEEPVEGEEQVKVREEDMADPVTTYSQWLLTAKKKSYRRFAARRLGELGDKRAIEALVQAKDAEDRETNMAVHRSFRNLTGTEINTWMRKEEQRKEEQEKFKQIALEHARITNVTIKDSVLQRTTIDVGNAGGGTVEIEDSVINRSEIGTEGSAVVSDSIVNRSVVQGEEEIEQEEKQIEVRKEEKSSSSEDNLAKYEKALMQSYKDGTITETEARLLEQLRKRFNISQDEHDMLVAMHFD